MPEVHPTPKSWKPFLAAVATLMVLVSVQFFVRTGVKGSGVASTLSKESEPFVGVESRGSVNIEIAQGEPGPLKITGDDNLLELVQTRVEDGVLIVETSESYSTQLGLTVSTSLPELKVVRLKGSGSVKGSGVFTGQELTVASRGSSEVELEAEYEKISLSVAGSGNIDLKGTCDELSVQLNGSGSLSARDMVCSETASVTSSGSGNCVVTVTGDLNAVLAGSGNVNHVGPARSVQKTISGSGSVSQI